MSYKDLKAQVKELLDRRLTVGEIASRLCVNSHDVILIAQRLK